MPPKAAKPSTKKFVFLEVAEMVFSINNFSRPTKEEYEAARWLEMINPDLLDSQELWVLENYVEEGDDE